MSEYALLICPSRQLAIELGKPLQENGVVFRFAYPDPEHRVNSANVELTRALWKFLAETAGEPIMVRTSYDEDYETIAGWPAVGGEPEDGDIPLEAYVEGFVG